jgi:tryptophan synthase alpha chain
MSDGAARLRAVFSEAGRPLFLPYLMGGFPDIETSLAHAKAVAPYADILELGIPFSDPLADGPTIQAAGHRALQAGTRPEDVLEIAEELRGGPPIALMTYVNIVMSGGPRGFLERAAKAGVAGLMLPDLPIDEGDEIRRAAESAGVALVPFCAPTTTNDRLAAIGRSVDSFVYCVSVTGVTGGALAVSDALRAFIARARAQIAAPLAVGFGIHGPEQAGEIGAFADGVAIGTKMIRIIEDTAPEHVAGELARFSKEIRVALSAARE